MKTIWPILKKLRVCLFARKEPAVVRARKRASDRARRSEELALRTAEETLHLMIKMNEKEDRGRDV